MTHVHLEHLTRIYPNTNYPAVNDLTLEIESGRLVAFLGPSGCGKTTTLKMIAGLIHPTRGDIRFDGNSVLAIPAEQRGAVMVFQNHLLFPYMNVAENIGFGLKMRGIDRKTIAHKVGEMLELVKLPGIARQQPRQLSGGQQQRVALARALIVEPKLLLLDEPLSNLDAHLRDEMRELILNIQRNLKVTTIVVTHDQQEAVLLADEIALLFDGSLQQYDEPEAYYRRPHSQSIARFFGGVNFVPGTRSNGCVETTIGTFRYDKEDKHDRDKLLPKDVLLTIRPEHVQLSRSPSSNNTVTGVIRSKIYMGTHTRYQILTGNVDVEVIEITGDYQVGDQVQIHLPSDRLWLLPDNSEALHNEIT